MLVYGFGPGPTAAWGWFWFVCFSPAPPAQGHRQRHAARLHSACATRRAWGGPCLCVALDLLRDRELKSKWILAHQRRISLIAHKEIAYSLYQSVGFTVTVK